MIPGKSFAVSCRRRVEDCMRRVLHLLAWRKTGSTLCVMLFPKNKMFYGNKYETKKKPCRFL